MTSRPHPRCSAPGRHPHTRPTSTYCLHRPPGRPFRLGTCRCRPTPVGERVQQLAITASGITVLAHPDRGPHLPVDHIVRYERPGVIGKPLERVEDLVGAGAEGSGIDALKGAAEHGVRHAEVVVRHNVLVLLDIHATKLARAKVVVEPFGVAGKVGAVGERALAVGDGEAGGDAGRVARQLLRVAKLLELLELPSSWRCGVAVGQPGWLARAVAHLLQPVLGLLDAQPGRAALKVRIVLAPHVGVLAQKLLGALVELDQLGEHLRGKSVSRRVVHAGGA
eukprot:5766945-Prymnesium_polylepis.1